MGFFLKGRVFLLLPMACFGIERVCHIPPNFHDLVQMVEAFVLFCPTRDQGLAWTCIDVNMLRIRVDIDWNQTFEIQYYFSS